MQYLYKNIFREINFKRERLHVAFLGMLLFFLWNTNFAVAANQNKIDPILEFAKQQVAQKFYQPAISTLNTYLSTHKDDTTALYWKGHCFYKLKNYQAAAENYLLLLKFSPRNFAANVDMANMMVLQKKYNEALPYFNKAISVNDTDINLVNSRGMCYYFAEKFELAIKDFKRVLKLDPNNFLAYNNLGSATYNNQNIADASIIDLKSAEVLFDKALDIKPDFELALRNRGIVRYYLDKLNLSYEDLLRAIQLDPKDENAYYYIGKVFYKQKNYPLALQFFDNAVTISNNPKFLLDRGICKLDMDDTKSARSDFYKSFQSGDSKGIAAYQLARTYGAEGDKQNAFAYLRDAKKYGLFVDTRYFNTLAKDKYFIGWEKDKEFIELVQELKFGRR